MMTTTGDPLESAIRDAGEGWLLDYFAPRSKAIEHIRATIAAVGDCARAKGVMTTIDEAAIVAEYQRNPHRIRAFFQALGGTRTPEMLLMAWRVMEGMEVYSMTLRYERQRSFELRIRLSSPYGGDPEEYASTKINDAALLRHFGIMEVDEQPFFDGIYPLRTR